MARPKSSNPRKIKVSFRLTAAEGSVLERLCPNYRLNFDNPSQAARDIILRLIEIEGATVASQPEQPS